MPATSGHTVAEERELLGAISKAFPALRLTPGELAGLCNLCPTLPVEMHVVRARTCARPRACMQPGGVRMHGRVCVVYMYMCARVLMSGG
jgi:hypothetical protein